VPKECVAKPNNFELLYAGVLSIHVASDDFVVDYGDVTLNRY
jgi:hypothetical protein